MKRLLMIILAICCLALPASAEREPLFPAYDDTGKGGYIDRQGNFVISPQYDYISEFRGDYALATLYPEGLDPSELDEFGFDDYDGIIDRTGRWVVPPEYYIFGSQSGSYFGGKDTGIWLVTKHGDNIWGEDEDGEEILLQEAGYGFFDIPSGCFSGLKWGSVWHWCSDSRLIPVIDWNGLAGYADRTTGETVIPCRYFANDPSNFYEGAASVAYEDEEGDPTDFFLIDETGAVIPLPEGMHSVYCCEVLGDCFEITDETGLIGFADLEGNILVSPRFEYVRDRTDSGISFVEYPEGDYGFATLAGETLLRGLDIRDSEPVDLDKGVFTQKTGKDEMTLFTLSGETVFVLQAENLVRLRTPLENGMCWYETDASGSSSYWMDRKFGLVDVRDGTVYDALWKLQDFEPISFPEGLQPVIRIVDGERKLGYLNERGELALPLIYDSASCFENGLARVTIGSRSGYIDTEGNEIFMWNID